MIVIKLVEAHEQPAACAGCSEFIDEWLCINFPAIYDAARSGYLCETCAREQAPGLFAMLRVICAGTLFIHQDLTDSPEAELTLDQLKTRCLELHMTHFSHVFGRPEPDYFLTSEATQ